MDRPLARVLNDFPYPAAYPYSLIFDESEQPSNRRWALCFTQYQVLRLVCLPLIGQYLRESHLAKSEESVGALNKAIAAIRSPFFSDWIALAYALRNHLPKVGIEPLFPGLGKALDSLKEVQERPFGLKSNTLLAPLNAILALRNGTAHGGLPDQAAAREHVEQYLSVLHQVLQAFDFLGDARLLVRCGETPDGIALVQTLRGVTVAPPVEQVLTEEMQPSFEDSPAIVAAPGGRMAALFPLFRPAPPQDYISLYDGHYGIQIHTREGRQERAYIIYLGVHRQDYADDSQACERLDELLKNRRMEFLLKKSETAPWTIADSALHYSRSTLDDLVGNKYFPECYLPIESMDRHFENFLRLAEAPVGKPTRRHVSGFILTGLAGAGKTAFLARQVERLLGFQSPDAIRENPNLVLFLRGNAVTVREHGSSLYAEVAERFGIAVEATAIGKRKDGEFSSFPELLKHFSSCWHQDRVESRRLILVLDALNEAPAPEKVIREALKMVGEASEYPWCKIVFSVRQEWLNLWPNKMQPNEASPIEVRPYLYAAPEDHERVVMPGERRLPVMVLEPTGATKLSIRPALHPTRSPPAAPRGANSPRRRAICWGILCICTYSC